METGLFLQPRPTLARAGSLRRIPTLERAASLHLLRSVQRCLSSVRTQILWSPFPQPVLLQIISYLPRSSLVSLLRVNSAFYWISLPLLYRQVTFDSRSPWPSFCPTIKLPPKGDLRSWLERNPLTTHVRQVDMLPHRTDRCVGRYTPSASFGPSSYFPSGQTGDNLALGTEYIPHLSHLRTLRVHVPPAGLHPDEHGSSFAWQCPAFTNLRPRKLVLIGSPSSVNGQTCLPYATLAAAEEYVLVMYPDPAVQDASPTSSLPELRARAIANDLVQASLAISATIIFQPHRPWTEFVSGVGVTCPLEDSWAGRFFEELGRALAQLGNATALRIVNAGSIDHGALGMDTWDPKAGAETLEATFRAGFKAEQHEAISKRRWTLARCDPSQITFVDMTTYLYSGDGVADVLGHARLMEWLHPGNLPTTPRRKPAPRPRHPRPVLATPRIVSPPRIRITSGPSQGRGAPSGQRHSSVSATGARIAAAAHAVQAGVRRVSDKAKDKSGAVERDTAGNRGDKEKPKSKTTRSYTIDNLSRYVDNL